MASRLPQTQAQKDPRKSKRKQDAPATDNRAEPRPRDPNGPKTPGNPGRGRPVQGTFHYTDWASI